MPRYIANFDDEYFGDQYKAGDEVKVPDEEGAEDQLRGALTDGRLTKIDDGDPMVPALGSSDAAEAPGAGDFDADGFIGRNLDDISDDDIAKLTPAQRDAVITAEKDREKPRTGLLSRLEA